MGKASAINSSSSSSKTTARALRRRAGGAPPGFMRAVVVELLNDPSYYTDDELLEKFKTIANPDILTGNPEVPSFSEEAGDVAANLRYLIPRNSVLVSLINAGRAKSESKLTLCFPFFPPYLQFPVKPGEQIWVISEKPTQQMTYLYWMCMITGPGFVDDINYTHLDRQILPDPMAITASFPNADGVENHFTLPGADAYDNIVLNSSSSLSFNPEPVPRLTKRPGDLVLQGSNNTLILMSDDRGWGADENPSDSDTSNASKTEEEVEKILAGSIDVVAGRGRFLTEPEVDALPVGTSPIVIENAREEQETGKYFLNPVEGDPDFVNDSSRVYVSMNTNGDEKLGLEYPSIDGADVEPVVDSPYVIIKSDEIRIVARKNDGEGINGSIKIVKEGEEGEDKAVIVIQPDGSILISGPKVSLGTGDTGDTQVLIGNDSGAEHLVKGETLEEKLNALVDKLDGHTHPTAVGPTGPPVAADNPASIFPRDFSASFSEVGRVK